MSLIPCPQCGHQVSDRATACPRCGRLVQKTSMQSSEAAHDSVPPPPPLPPQVNGAGRGILFVGIAVCCLGGVSLAVLLLGSTRGKEPEVSNGKAEDSQRKAAESERVTEEARSRGEPSTSETMAAWTALGKSLQVLQPPRGATPAEFVASLRREAQQIASRSRSNVDGEVVLCGEHVAAALRNMADAIEQAQAPEKVVDWFGRGMQDDPLASPDTSASLSPVRQQLEYIEQRVKAVKESLSSRYGGVPDIYPPAKEPSVEGVLRRYSQRNPFGRQVPADLNT
jgi:hypothetical protein